MVDAGDGVSDPDEVRWLAAARAAVQARIEQACARVGRDSGSVTLVAVSKTVPIDRLRAALAAGHRVLGENRVQEATAKVPALAGPGGPAWHLVGPLQANKARRAVELFDVLEAIDSVALVARLDRLVGELRSGRRLPIYLQVNVDQDPAKAGFEPGDLTAALAAIGRPRNVELTGLMTVGRVRAGPEDARPTFRRLRELSEQARAAAPALGPGLSMGMSDDFEPAIEEGATVVRVGRALFGERAAGTP